MATHYSPVIRTFVPCLVVLGFAVAAHAGGPLRANGAGQPLIWQLDPIPYNPDRGTLGALSDTSATARLASSAVVWTAVPSSYASLVAAALLPVDVTVANYAEYLFTCDDGLSPIVFDTNGTITDELFGIGAHNHVLGFAAPACSTSVPPVFTEGFATLNGRFLDGIDNATNPELTPEEFDAVLIHELGHYIGLDHS